MTQGPPQDPENESPQPADPETESEQSSPAEDAAIPESDPQDEGSNGPDTGDNPDAQADTATGRTDTATDQSDTGTNQADTATNQDDNTTDQPHRDADARKRSLDKILDRLDRTQDEQPTDAEADTEQPDSGFEWIADSLEDGSTGDNEPLPADDHVLLLTPRRDHHADAACMSLATPVEPRHLNALFVSLNRTSEELLDHWQAHEQELPANLGVVPVGEQIRSTTTTNPGGEDGYPSHISITPATDPSDLTRLGITVNKLLEGWADGGHRTTMCIDSLTTFLQYVEPERLFRFLHLLQSRVDRVDGVAHYHMNPTAHDEETVNIFATLVDTVATVEDDGSISVGDYHRDRAE